jgi:hypothetical protein
VLLVVDLQHPFHGDERQPSQDRPLQLGRHLAEKNRLKPGANIMIL